MKENLTGVRRDESVIDYEVLKFIMGYFLEGNETVVIVRSDEPGGAVF